MSDEKDSPIAAKATISRRGPGSVGGHGPGGVKMRGEKAKDFKGTMLKLLGFLGRYRVRLLLVFAFAIGSTVFSIIGPKVLSVATTVLFNGVVEQVAGTGGIDFEQIGKIILGTLALYILSTVCSWLQGWIMSYVSQNACYELRNKIEEKINKLPFGRFEQTSKGDVLSRITNDVDTLGQSMNQGVTQLITSTVTVIGVVVMMFSINWIMTLIALCMVPLSIFVVAIVVSKSQKYFFAQQSLLGAINGQVEETFSGHEVVKAFGHESETIDKFEAANGELEASAWKSQFLSGLLMPAMNFIGNLGYVAVAVAGSFLAVAGAVTVGDIQAFIQYVKNFTQPITQLAQVSNVLQQMAAAAERIFNFLAEPEMEPDIAKAQLPVCTNVRFDEVTFAYEPNNPVLDGFNASCDDGQTVAIVGPTGAGKTTLMKLLLRFYDVSSGDIRIGGDSIYDFSREELRSLFSMVLQDSWLFSGSIRENIRFGELDASDAEVEQAAKDACAHHFISALPGGYDFQINEDASNISAGQRQLIAIARALIAKRRMLILDEATSSVDVLTEARIQEAMDRLMEGKTSFVIAHRLSTIRNASLIVVMGNGRIVESGTHDELIAKNGEYARLYNSQFE